MYPPHSPTEPPHDLDLQMRMKSRPRWQPQMLHTFSNPVSLRSFTVSFWIPLQVLLQHIIWGCHEESGRAPHPSTPTSEVPLSSLLAGPQQALPAGSSRYSLLILIHNWNTRCFIAFPERREVFHSALVGLFLWFKEGNDTPEGRQKQKHTGLQLSGVLSGFQGWKVAGCLLLLLPFLRDRLLHRYAAHMHVCP